MNFDNYTISADLTVIAICVVMVILLTTSFVTNNRSFRIFLTIIGLLITASLVNIFYHVLLAGRNPDTYNLIYILRLTYHAILFDVLFLFTLYATVASGMEHSKARMIAIISSALFALVVIIDIVQSYNGVGFRILEDGTVIDDSRIF
ncbi:MAG: hypothetical protein J6S49_00265, partial [Erysipelotrichaceae bacterium]|nr:hypothetical protein [Erysipelotrichaceae bacterium]